MFATAPENLPDLSRVYYSSILLWVTLLPLLAGIALYFLKDSFETLRKAVALIASLAVLAGVLALMPMVLTGSVIFDLVDFMQMGLFFEVDLVAWIFAFLIAFVWFLATLFSFTYMDLEHNRRRFYSVLIFTLGATLGVVLSGDFFTLFLFFEMMTLSSFILVIHEQNREAMQAGILYLYLGIAGGLALLFAIMMLYSATGTVDISPVLGDLGGYRTTIYVLFLIGFGVKAGLVPLHIWLPQAHPVAPSPASALLSGILIKTGAYGILRVSLTVFSTPGETGAADTAYLFTIGSALMWIGIITMFSGAIMALLQSNMKRILAYSSVSQIGYIATGIGAAMFMGAEGAMGFAGAIYHVINHALFKAGLFMMVGTIYIYTHELELSNLGGMFKKMPLVGITFLIAAFGIAGIPGFNGYPSKTLIHDALLIAIKYHDLISIEVAEKIFTLTSALTICYFIKLFRGVFLGPVPEKLDRDYKLTFSTKAVLTTFGSIIIAIGLFPNYILERFLVQPSEMMGYEGYAMDHLYHFHFFEWHPLEAMLIVVVLALVIYIPGAYRGWFDWQPPSWLSIYALVYRPLTNRLMILTCKAGVIIDSAVDDAYTKSGGAARNVCGYVGNVDQGLDRFYHKWGALGSKLADRSRVFDEKLDGFYQKSGKAARKIADKSTEMDAALDSAYKKTGEAAQKLAKQTTDLDRAINVVYDQAGKKTREEVEKHLTYQRDQEDQKETDKWTTKNLSFDNLLLVLVLGVVLIIIFYFGRS